MILSLVGPSANVDKCRHSTYIASILQFPIIYKLCRSTLAITEASLFFRLND